MWNPFTFWKKKKFKLLPAPGEPRMEPDDPKKLLFWIGAIVGSIVGVGNALGNKGNNKGGK
jgi:LPS O-antigen subunit length determinant protein (WzzB/FepE family)